MNNELYQEIILEHNKNPKNFHTMSDHTHDAEGYNPLCGDQLHVYLKLDDNKIISEISFHGAGCAISKASASMMTQFLTGKTVEEAKEIFDQYHKLIIGELDPEKDKNNLGKLKIFSGIKNFPSRVKCAILAWHTAISAIDKKSNVNTEDNY